MTERFAPLVAVVVVAAGSGRRLGRVEPKAFVALAGRTLLEHAVYSVSGMKEAAQVILVVPADRVADTHSLVASVFASAGPVVIVAGGSSRQESVKHGVAELLPSVQTVLVHDAARALTPAALFDRVVDAVESSGTGIIPGLPVTDTIKRVNSAGEALATVDRSELSAVQTPQGFPRDILVGALASARIEHTDDAALVAAAGHPVRVVTGDPLAFKITTAADLDRAEQLLARTPPGPRTGTGLDVHAFADGAELWLAGLHWPGERGLSGHSDGDVAVHAICDALLGAAGLGDIGVIFGTADPSLVGAHGDVFLRETLRLITEAGFRVSNVSVQIIGNRPRLAPRRAEAQAWLSGILNAPVNVSATTTDALGFTGRGEGLAALANALLLPLTASSTERAAHLSWGP